MILYEINTFFKYFIFLGLAYGCMALTSDNKNLSEATQNVVPEDNIIASSTPTPFVKDFPATEITEFINQDAIDMYPEDPLIQTVSSDSAVGPFTFEVFDKKRNNEICIRVQMKLSVSVPYYKNGSKQIYFANSTLHEGAEYHGLCNDSDSSESWRLQINLMKNWRVIAIWLPFIKNSPHSADLQSKATSYSLQTISLQYYLDNKTAPGTNRSGFFNTSSTQKERFVTEFSGYYSCSTKSELKIGKAMFYISDFKMQIYKSGNSSDFHGTPVVQCLNDIPVNTIVPIVVGIALAALTVIILLAYVIGRQRYQTVEYENLITA